ncbi:hypothetical protein ACWGH7_19540 [Streptomyces cyaneofuscatus]|uniref:hypothetical protein n=1 Tax=Streptomyces cyaneofuscatus TaxID=66883 RepID=UPI0033F91A5A
MVRLTKILAERDGPGPPTSAVPSLTVSAPPAGARRRWGLRHRHRQRTRHRLRLIPLGGFLAGGHVHACGVSSDRWYAISYYGYVRYVSATCGTTV